MCLLRSTLYPKKVNYRKIYKAYFKCSFKCIRNETYAYIFKECTPILEEKIPHKGDTDSLGMCG